MICDKAKKRRPELCCAEIVSATCGCGRTYRRCINHDGMIGVRRSLAAHKTMTGSIVCQLPPVRQ